LSEARQNVPLASLRDAIFTHPTMAKGLTVLFRTVTSGCENDYHSLEMGAN